MNKLYSFCNLLVESYCNDAAIEPFSSSTGPSMSTQKQPQKQRQKQTMSDNKGLRWKTGVIIMLLDCILNDELWQNGEEQHQFILNLYDYLILCIAIDNREIRKRISRLFGGCIKTMLKIPNKSENEEGKELLLKVDTNRIVSVWTLSNFKYCNVVLKNIKNPTFQRDYYQRILHARIGAIAQLIFFSEPW